MIIQDPIYQNRVEFLYGKREDVIPRMKELGVQEENLPVKKDDGLVVEADSCFVIWVEDSKNMSILVHEIYHVVDAAFGFLGIEGENDSEFGACLAEYYMREICNHLAG